MCLDAFRQRVARVKAQASGGVDLHEPENKVGLDGPDLMFGSEVRLAPAEKGRARESVVSQEH